MFVVVPQRMTPVKHSIPHMRAAFGPGGQLVRVLPNNPADGQPATVELTDITHMLDSALDNTDLRLFPGPLVKYVRS